MQFLAHGMSVIAGWDGTEDLSALAAFVRSLGRQDCGRDEFNVVIAVSGDALEDDALYGVAAVSSEVGATLCFSGGYSPVREAKKYAPSNVTVTVPAARGLPTDFLSRGRKSLLYTGSEITFKDEVKFELKGEAVESSKFCFVIPTSIPSLAPRISNAVASVRAQHYEQSKLDVLIAYSFNEICGEKELLPLLKLCRENGIALHFNKHDHRCFPPALARNVGARRACDRTVVFLDADMVLHPRTTQWAKILLAEKKCVVYVEPAMMAGVSPVDRVFKDFDVETFAKAAAKGASAPGTGAVVFVPQWVLKETHGYDERFVGYGFTDWDFTGRVRKVGAKVVNLTEETGIRAMHQPHGFREATNPQNPENEKYYNENGSGKPTVNPHSWGGIVVGEGERGGLDG